MRATALLCLLAFLLAGTALAQEPAVPGSVPARIVLTFANAPLGAPAPAGASTPRYVGGGYQLGQGAHARARSVARQYGLKEVASWPIQQLAVHCVVYEVRPGEDVQDLLARLARDARVTLAEPLQEFHTLSGPEQAALPYNDPLYDLQTNLAELDIARAHQRARGAGVRVGLIDTGVDVHHPDLRGRIGHFRSFVTATPASPRAYRHGTAMAGLIAAVANNHIGIVGIAPLAQINVYEACWQLKADADAAACNTFTLARALAAALDDGVPLINLSLSGPGDALLAALVQVGLGRGVTFVGAAAPSAGFPGAIAGVIVAGSAQHDSWPAQLTAPADHIFTLCPQGQYDFESGTSVAAAEVSGAIALLISASKRRLSSETLASLLMRSAMQSGTVTPAVPALNINEALTRLDDRQHRTHVLAGMH
jgi:subtilisin family serine protease